MGFKLKSIDRVFRKVGDYPFIGANRLRHKIGFTGKKIKSKVFGTLFGKPTSARSYSSDSSSIYGPTGSIVGRF